MKLLIDKGSNGLVLAFKDVPGIVKRSEKMVDGITLLFDELGICVAIEVSNLSKLVGHEILSDLGLDFEGPFEIQWKEVDIKPFPDLPGTERK